MHSNNHDPIVTAGRPPEPEATAKKPIADKKTGIAVDAMAAPSTAPTDQQDRGGEEPWIALILHRIRRALVRHGVDPAVHSGGLHVNERLVLMAMGGATDEEIAATADQLKREHVLHDEEPEPEIPPGAEDPIE